MRRWIGWSGTRGGPTRSLRCYGSANPVAGPYFNISSPEPTGVVAIVAPQSFLGLVSVLAPVIVTGNTCVVVTPAAVEAITFAEVLATSDLPGGVVNILTGSVAEVVALARLARRRQRPRPDRRRRRRAGPRPWSSRRPARSNASSAPRLQSGQTIPASAA